LIDKFKALDRGIVMMLLASLCFAIMGGFVKMLVGSIPPIEAAFFRNLFGVVIIGITILRVPIVEIGGKPWLLFFRGFMGFVSLVAFFYVVAYLPFGQAAMYNKISPIFVAIFAYLFLQEKLSRWAIVAVALGFAGVVLVAKPDSSGFGLYDIIGLLSGVGAALAYTSIRELRHYYDTRSIVLSFMIVGTVGPLIMMIIGSLTNGAKNSIFTAPFVMPSGIEWAWIIGIGISATISQMLMTKAYEYTKAGIIGTISYSNIIFATIIGVMLGDALPDVMTIFGIILVIISGILVTIKPKPNENDNEIKGHK